MVVSFEECRAKITIHTIKTVRFRLTVQKARGALSP